ncbi:6324_t:CDS:10 [Ambispora gerdemannii]|uniref:V-type proton ATPase subunit H n=1 Tax=Ambispora gerdemannii TaxID=144530 RepID=A0A9N8UYB9_9GLOM|nr:6324_t:CDS:10 [Ambispora gerdemannii]
MSTTNSNSNEVINKVPMVFVSNSYLEEFTDTMRRRPIPWEGYQRADIITHEEFELIIAVENISREQLQTILDKDGDKYAQLYISLLERTMRIDTVQHILVLISDMLSENEKRAVYFHNTTIKDPKLPYRPFLKILTRDDDFIPLASAKILTILVCTAPKPPLDFTEFFQWIVSKLKSNNNHVSDLGVQILGSILKVPEYRKKTWNTPQALDNLVYLLKERNLTPQMLYQIIFCFWLLTFDGEIAANFNKKYDIIPTLIDIAKSAIKEKIIRVIIGTFRNMIEKAPEENFPAMLVAKLLNFLENLSGRKWSDTEIVEDIEFLKTQLLENFQSLTTFDVYASEIRSGMLHWSPPHQSEQFWKQNAQKLNEKDYELLRILARILSTSSDNLVLSVAAHDLGQYVKYCTSGKKFLQEIGAKQRIMELMTHEDPDVRYQALLAVQKYMTNAW